MAEETHYRFASPKHPDLKVFKGGSVAAVFEDGYFDTADEDLAEHLRDNVKQVHERERVTAEVERVKGESEGTIVDEDDDEDEGDGDD